MKKTVETIENFAKYCHDLLISDRDLFIGIGGFTGEGKSTFAIKLLRAYGKIRGEEWSFDNMTYRRDELLTWVDGDKKTGEGQLPEYSAILPDELISMFYKRNWYEDGQKSAVELFNKCRDRHLLIAGNVPDFWDLDSGLISRFRYYVYIPKRGIAWVFQQENNPFSNDPWNKTENRKKFRQYGHRPWSLKNFVCEIQFDDLDPKEKEEYYHIRNTKRKNTEGQSKKVERYGKIKKQRDELIRYIFSLKEHLKKESEIELTQKGIAEIIECDPSVVSYAISGRGER